MQDSTKRWLGVAQIGSIAVTAIIAISGHYIERADRKARIDAGAAAHATQDHGQAIEAISRDLQEIAKDVELNREILLRTLTQARTQDGDRNRHRSKRSRSGASSTPPAAPSRPPTTRSVPESLPQPTPRPPKLISPSELFKKKVSKPKVRKAKPWLQYEMEQKQIEQKK